MSGYQEGVPFQRTVYLAVAVIAHGHPPSDTHTHGLVDSRYHRRRLRQAAVRRGWDISGGLPRTRLIRISAAEGKPNRVPLSTDAAGLNTTDRIAATWPAQQGGHTVSVHVVRTWVRTLGPTLVVITRTSLDQPPAQARSWGSTLVAADVQTIIAILATRWPIETLFEDDKDVLGSDHDQVTSAPAIVRCWTPVACLASFLDKQRVRLQVEQPGKHITWGNARRAIQSEQQRNLRLWLEDRFRSGSTAGQLCACLAA